MRDLETVLERIGVKTPEILLPANNIDISKWSVIACDQYTSQPEYWGSVEKKVGASPSTLNLIFPEVYLEEPNPEKRIAAINHTMQYYLDEKILDSQGPCFLYVERTISCSKLRKGLIIAVDLEQYDYGKGTQTLIRATEGTVLERIPPRVKIRENAPIELPHIMLLIDDADRTVIEPLGQKSGEFEKVYDFELMMDGGHIKGYKISDEANLINIAEALDKLADPHSFLTRYGVGPDKGVLLFAAGDGNHSLASAKAHWENVKHGLSSAEVVNHPARFALVEVVNIHDEGLVFEPIHRVVFNIKAERLLDCMVSHFSKNSHAFCNKYDTMELLNNEVEKLSGNKGLHILPFISDKTYGMLIVENPRYNLEVGTLQSFLDEYAKQNSDMKIDYIHGEEAAAALGSKEGNICFFLPPMDKHDLFKTVILDGALPRKTFSMGESEEKRYYLECRKIAK